MPPDALPSNVILLPGRARPPERLRPRGPRHEAAELASHEELISRLELLEALAPSAPLSFLLVRLDGIAMSRTADTQTQRDQLIARASGVVSAQVRATDLVGRLSGDSLGIILQGTGTAGAATVAARLSFRLRQELRAWFPGVGVRVYAASGRGMNAATLAMAVLDGQEECS